MIELKNCDEFKTAASHSDGGWFLRVGPRGYRHVHCPSLQGGGSNYTENSGAPVTTAFWDNG